LSHPAFAVKTETFAKLACVFAGLVWGLFWIPIRTLAEAGIGGVWATLCFYAIPCVLVLPLFIWRWRQTIEGGLWLQFLGLTAAISLVLYSIAMLYTEVVRAMLLFYLTPLWSTLLARAVLGEPITRMRWLAMALGFTGMLVIFQADIGIPLPQKTGDWLALASGLLWSAASVLLRADKGTSTIELFTQNFIWSGIVALAFIAIARPDFASSPPFATYVQQLPWLVPVIIIVVMSGVYATMWGAPKLNPGIVGLLFMTEISVGAITAALWSGDPFGWREATGIVLITAAGMLEGIRDLALMRRTQML
jgi:drug/metabolite transporter (DMT)-like permease